MIKPIKFDLKLNDGTAIRTLDDLEENLTPELFQHFHSGKLAKWLRVRKLDELADKMEALQAEYLEDKNELDVQLFKKLCEVFVSEVDENDALEAVAEFKAMASPVENAIDSEEVEQLKAQLAVKESEVEQAKFAADKRQSEELDELRNLCRYYQKNLSDTLPRLNSIAGRSLTLSFASFLPRFDEISPQIKEISDRSDSLYDFVEAFNAEAELKCKNLGL